MWRNRNKPFYSIFKFSKFLIEYKGKGKGLSFALELITLQAKFNNTIEYLDLRLSLSKPIYNNIIEYLIISSKFVENFRDYN